MKGFLALGLLTLSSVSLAASRDIYDIMYLPDAGTTFGFSEVNYVSGKIESNVDTEFSGYDLTQVIGHSFTDRLSVQGELSYNTTRFDPSPGNTYDWTGLRDPKISARFRTMDEKYRLDVFGGVVLGFGDQEIKANRDQNNVSGGPSFFFGSQVGEKKENYQWALSGTFQHNLARDVNDKPRGQNYETDAHNEITLQADSLMKLKEVSFLRTFISARMVEASDRDTLTPTTIAPQTTYKLGAEYQHLCSKNLLARLGLDYNTINVDTGNISEYHFWNFRIAANYQF